jgi:hypothetical protein
MVTLELNVSPESFNVSPEEPKDEQLMAREGLPPIQELRNLEPASQHATSPRVMGEPPSLSEPVPSRLKAEGTERSATLDLPLRLELSNPPSFRLQTTDGAQGVELVLFGHPDRQANLKISIRYEGLPVSKALSYVRFLHALFWEEGILYLTAQESEDEKIELFDLPLPLDAAEKSEIEDRLSFLEALDEIGRATNTEFVYPSEVGDEDLSNMNHVLKAIRSGWVALRVTDFTTSVSPETAKTLLEFISQEGGVMEGLAMTVGERYKIFGTGVDLGLSLRYISSARVQTSHAEIEEWLASGPSQGSSFEVCWVPIDNAPVHVFYYDWPKPSLELVRRNLKAFENEYGMPSDEFRRAWEDGESRARNIENADIWISFLNAQEALK